MRPSIIERDINSEILPEFRERLKELEGKNVLVAGANGFILSYLVDTFHIYNKTSLNPIKLYLVNKSKIDKSSRLSHLIDSPNVEFLTIDLSRNFSLPDNINIIIHGASRSSPAYFLANPLETIDTNVVATRNFLDYAKKNSIDQFFLYSSGDIYGDPDYAHIPTKEDYTGSINCLDKLSCYVEAKRFSESLSGIYRWKFNTPIKISRILLAYGPGIRSDGKVVSDFFKKSILEKKISIKDRGESKRSFCYISDVTRATLRIFFDGFFGEAYHIGNDLENVTIKELAETIAKVVNNGTIVETNSALEKESHISNRMLDISKLRSLGFKPRINLENGLYRMKEYYDETGL